MAVLSAVSTIAFLSTPSVIEDISWVKKMVGMTLLCFLFWTGFTRNDRKGSLFDPVILFSISYIIVFFQIPLLVSEGVPVAKRYCPFNELINIGASLAFMGYSFFCLGYFCFKRIAVNSYSFERKGTKKSPCLSGTAPESVNILLTLSVVVYLLFLSSVGTEVLSGFIYAGTSNWEGYATYFFAFLEVSRNLLFSICGLKASKRKPHTLIEYFRKYDNRVLLLFVVSTLPFLLIGDRGAILLPLLFFIAPYFVLRKRLRARIALLFLVVAVIASVFLGSMRTRESNDTWGVKFKRGYASVVEAATSHDKFPTYELAKSYRIFNVALDIVPKEENYGRGRYSWGSMVGMIPFYDRFFGHYGLALNSSRVFTNYFYGYADNVGTGSCLLGAIFLDFGALGIPLIMLVVGATAGLVASLNFTSVRNGVWFHFIYCYSFFYFLRLPRSAPFGWTQLVVWGLGLFIIIRYLEDRQKDSYLQVKQ